MAHGNWIPAAEYFALLAFGPARSDWRLSKAIADYHADYGLQWVNRAEAIANNATYARKVRARMLKLRKRRLPLETAAVRRRVVGDLLRELPNREREIREGAEALEDAKEKALSEILTGETEVCVSDVTAGPMQPLRPVNASFFMQGMTLDVEGRLVPQPQLNPDERRTLYSRAKADNLGHVWLRTAELQSPQAGRGAHTIAADMQGTTADATVEPPPAGGDKNPHTKKRRGPRPEKRDKIVSLMETEFAPDLARLDEEKEVTLAHRYSASHDTVRKAREQVLDKLRQSATHRQLAT